MDRHGDDRVRRRFTIRKLGPIILALVLTAFASARGQAPSGEGLKAEILAVKISDERKPIVTFRIGDAKGSPLDRGDLGEIRFTIARSSGRAPIAI